MIDMEPYGLRAAKRTPSLAHCWERQTNKNECLDLIGATIKIFGLNPQDLRYRHSVVNVQKKRSRKYCVELFFLDRMRNASHGSRLAVGRCYSFEAAISVEKHHSRRSQARHANHLYVVSKNRTVE